MTKFVFTPLITDADNFAARLGAGTGAANNFVNTNENGKFVKLVGDSRYDLCAAGDAIEGAIVTIESATLDGYTIGTVQEDGRLNVVLDGLQATPGVGAIAIGDYVVCGTAVAKGTALTAAPKVCKATNQPGAAVTVADNLQATINAALALVADQIKNAKSLWRLVSASGTIVGSTGVIEKLY